MDREYISNRVHTCITSSPDDVYPSAFTEWVRRTELEGLVQGVYRSCWTRRQSPFDRAYLQSRGNDEEIEKSEPPCGFGEGKMKKWGVELESQNEQTLGTHTHRERDRREWWLNTCPSRKQLKGEEREVPLRRKLCWSITDPWWPTSPVEAGAETRM